MDPYIIAKESIEKERIGIDRYISRNERLNRNDIEMMAQLSAFEDLLKNK
jgi:hypothetical protein